MEAFKAFLSSGFSVAELTQRATLTTWKRLFLHVFRLHEDSFHQLLCYLLRPDITQNLYLLWETNESHKQSQPQIYRFRFQRTFFRTKTIGHPVESLLPGLTVHRVGNMQCFLTLTFVTRYLKHSISTWCSATFYFRLQ